MKTYNQLTEIQRYQIEALNKAEKKQNEIAEILGVSPSTISRELKRNRGKRGYRPKQANIKATNRRGKASKAIKMTDDAIDLIEDKLYLDWSPDQISGWLKQEQVIPVFILGKHC